jgi:hypothetical protein
MRLAKLAGELDGMKTKRSREIAAEIQRIVDQELYRQSPARRMKNKSWPVTKAVKDRILHLAETTDMHEHEIAVSVGVNHGRVSEVLNGLR